eukprot:scaffold293572_cov30-Tisochrysis_lutea.AAC.2
MTSALATSHLVLPLQILDHVPPLLVCRLTPLPRITRAFGARRLAQEGIPLHAPISDIGCHKVFARADVHLSRVPHREESLSPWAYLQCCALPTFFGLRPIA